MNTTLRIFVVLLFAFQTSLLKSNTRLPAIFSSNMVLQQNSEVSIWGWEDPSGKVKIVPSWSQDTITTITGNTAKWRANLKTPSAGGPFTIKIIGTKEIVLENILIGEVWLCSGQSNMEWSSKHGKGYNNAETEVKNANYPKIRLFHVQKSGAEYRQDDLLNGTWKECSPESVEKFSGTAYFFGRSLFQKLNVPIGLIHSSWGGTAAEVWTPKEIIESDDELLSSAKKLNTYKWWPSESGVLFNAMIAPLVPFKIRGAIWYQGESNVGDPLNYTKLFPTMINAWRQEWGEDFPFYYVQIAPFKYGKEYRGAMLRESQLKCLSLKNTGMAVISDIGDTTDIHPMNKQDVGARLAQWAFAKTYNMKDINYSGPLYKGMKREKDKIRISFDYAENGLKSNNGDALNYFEIAGEDRVFRPAKAKIDGNTVVVSNKKIKKPVAVRFAFTNTATPNLVNTEGLPASTFRTDDWIIEIE